jgi:hypothetical protein
MARPVGRKRGPLPKSGPSPDFLQHPLKRRLWGKAHGSIRIQEGEPRSPVSVGRKLRQRQFVPSQPCKLYVVFQMAEVAIPRQMFQEILRLMSGDVSSSVCSGGGVAARVGRTASDVTV